MSDGRFTIELEKVGNTLYLCDRKPEDHPGGVLPAEHIRHFRSGWAVGLSINK